MSHPPWPGGSLARTLPPFCVRVCAYIDDCTWHADTHTSHNCVHLPYIILGVPVHTSYCTLPVPFCLPLMVFFQAASISVNIITSHSALWWITPNYLNQMPFLNHTIKYSQTRVATQSRANWSVRFTSVHRPWLVMCDSRSWAGVGTVLM